VQITAAVVEEQSGPFTLRELELGELRDDEVLVEVAAAGICHTDLICRDQWLPVPLPAVLGHEGAGVVVEVGRRAMELAAGDRVAMSYDCFGECPACLQGRGAYCYSFFSHNFAASRPEDGSSALGEVGGNFFCQSSFATHSVARERNVVKLDADIPFEIAAPFGCGIQTGAGAVLNGLQPEEGSSIPVFGAGAVGLDAVMAASLSGCNPIVVVDRRWNRLELAQEVGATHVVDASTVDP
jgi:aryl-alcohol dehydrogenase